MAEAQRLAASAPSPETLLGEGKKIPALDLAPLLTFFPDHHLQSFPRSARIHFHRDLQNLFTTRDFPSARDIPLRSISLSTVTVSPLPWR